MVPSMAAAAQGDVLAEVKAGQAGTGPEHCWYHGTTAVAEGDLGGARYLAWLGILTHSSFIRGGKFRWVVIHVQDADAQRGP